MEAALSYQKVMETLDGIHPSEHPLAAKALGRWSHMRAVLEREGKLEEAENKGLSTISVEMKDLAGRAREMKLQPQEYQGGTFSISNLGMMGIKSFGSIINEPHGMILSVGAGGPRPVVKDGELAIATVMTVTLTCDHRVVDGALGAEWLGVFKRYVESPITMML
jgi:pyruvate dehydrogenase E2 component (dihydrolipoamide acetyltransferase)